MIITLAVLNLEEWLKLHGSDEILLSLSRLFPLCLPHFHQCLTQPVRTPAVPVGHRFARGEPDAPDKILRGCRGEPPIAGIQEQSHGKSSSSHTVPVAHSKAVSRGTQITMLPRLSLAFPDFLASWLPPT